MSRATYLKGFKQGLGFYHGAKSKGFAQDAAKWITVHPNGTGANQHGQNITGSHVLIDGETGTILGGMGGKFTGKHISKANAQTQRKEKAETLSKTEIKSKNTSPKPQARALENTQEAMTEAEYLDSKGVGSAFSDYLLDKLRSNPNKTERSKKRFIKEANRARNEFFDKREQAKAEYKAKIESGELRDKTPLERRLRTAQGHEDNESVQAARRLLAKQGIDWKTGKALNAKGEETLQKNAARIRGSASTPTPADPEQAKKSDPAFKELAE